MAVAVVAVFVKEKEPPLPAVFIVVKCRGEENKSIKLEFFQPGI